MKSSKHFDVIVIGVGSMGSASCYHLASRGLKVLGLEQFNVVHERGSHTGQSRIIRKAYFEHPDYVPLLERAYHNWHQIEQQAGVKVYYQTGIVYFGDHEDEIMAGIRNAAALYNIPLQSSSREESGARFSQFQIPKDFETLFEPDAGFITPERAIRMYSEQATRHGALIRENTKVIYWKVANPGVEVVTDHDSYTCDKLVITAGSWTSKLVPDPGNKLTVTRQLLAWVQPENPDSFRLGNFPCWFIEDPSMGLFYGFPMLSEKEFGGPSGIKIAHHQRGDAWDPDNTDRVVPPGTAENIRHLLQKYLPIAGEHISFTQQCLYTYSPDSNFIIDHLPGTNKRVSIACGFSGHGFKFVPVVGEILADLATRGSTDLPIDFLRLQRFQSIFGK